MKLSDMRAPMELLSRAWGIIANAGEGDWTEETKEWAQTARQWKDDYHKWLYKEDQ